MSAFGGVLFRRSRTRKLQAEDLELTEADMAEDVDMTLGEIVEDAGDLVRALKIALDAL